MCSCSRIAPRRAPQQERGHRRVAGLLQAAASVLAKSGYESATMCAIAERAGSSIGSLYQFYPNKESLAEALRTQYIGEVEELYSVLASKAAVLSADDLIDNLVRAQIEFANSHRAFLTLLDAPPTVNSWRRRDLIRDRIARVLLARKCGLSRKEAVQAGAVVHQIVRGLLTLYARAGPGEKTAVIKEFNAVLAGYLMPKLQRNNSTRSSHQRATRGFGQDSKRTRRQVKREAK